MKESMRTTTTKTTAKDWKGSNEMRFAHTQQHLQNSRTFVPMTTIKRSCNAMTMSIPKYYPLIKWRAFFSPSNPKPTKNAKYHFRSRASNWCSLHIYQASIFCFIFSWHFGRIAYEILFFWYYQVVLSHLLIFFTLVCFVDICYVVRKYQRKIVLNDIVFK